MSARSPVLRALLVSAGAGSGLVRIEDVEPIVFHALLQYIYTEGACGGSACGRSNGLGARPGTHAPTRLF